MSSIPLPPVPFSGCSHPTLRLFCVPSSNWQSPYNPQPPLRICRRGRSMSSVHFVVGSQILSNKFLMSGLTACASVLLLASSANAESNRSCATLQIQVTLVPTLRTAPTGSPTTSESGTVSFDLKPNNHPTLTQQTTTHPMTPSNSNSSKLPGTSNAGAPAVLETLTIVAQ